MRHKVVAISVTYNPGSGEIERLVGSALPQVAGLVVVDNGSRDDVRTRLPLGSSPNLRYISLGDNYGIAAALNRGIESARKEGATHVLLLDQDSTLADDMVARLLDAAAASEAQGLKVAAVGPRYLDPRQENPPPFIRIEGLRLHRCRCDPSNAVLPVDYLISSGSLVPMAVFDAVGAMDESLFIDYVDIEWGLRAKVKGFQSFGVCNATMYHNLGETPIHFFGKNLPLHSPLRHYYHFRNAVALYRSGWVPGNWKIVDGYRLLLKFGFYTLFAKPRLQHFRMMSLGIWHGLAGRCGRLDRK